MSELCNQAKEDLVEEGRGTCDRGQRPVSRDRRALLGARSPTTSASSKGNWGVDAKARHLKDLVHYLQINVGRAGVSIRSCQYSTE